MPILKKLKFAKVLEPNMHKQQGDIGKHDNLVSVESASMSSEIPTVHEHLYTNIYKSDNFTNVLSNAGTNINKFHKSMSNFMLYQCRICQEAWSLKRKPKSSSSYISHRCSLDTVFQSPKCFWCITTQIEEMVIAQALLIMKVYTKPPRQRGYSAHCINLPHKITDVAKSLPWCPKDIPVELAVTMKGRNNTFKDVVIRKNKTK